MSSILDEPTASNPYHYKPCYNCQKTDYTKVKSTRWGGLLGPQLLNHVKCNSCGKTYNGKTGQSNHKNIWLYSGAILTVTIILIFGLSFLGLL